MKEEFCGNYSYKQGRQDMLRGVLKAVDECSYVTKFGEKYIDKMELIRLLKLKESKAVSKK